MTEAALQARIKKAMEAAGWLVLRPITNSTAGWPDLFCLRAGRTCFIEVKQPGNKPTRLQAVRHRQLEDQGFMVIIATSTEDVRPLIVT
jgi:Holliday junction resolvase